MGISSTALASRFPLLYHMAEDGSWPSIEKHGLLSTSALLDLFNISGTRRACIEAAHRRESVQIQNHLHGVAIIRDQKPMSDRGLSRCLQDHLSPVQWYKILNEKVFFWLTRPRLYKLLNAKFYRNKRHCLLTIDTGKLLERHASRVLLSSMNSGCTKPYPHPRGRDTFLSLDNYPYEHWNRKRRGKDPIVELTVHYSVPDIKDLVIRVEEWDGQSVSRILR